VKFFRQKCHLRAVAIDGAPVETWPMRWAITKILYRLHWTRFQKWFWRYWKPIILAMFWVFALN
jgi:hypothetical protein